MPPVISVFGSDARQHFLAELLIEDGFSVVYTCDIVSPGDILLLPVPTISSDGMLRGTTTPFFQFLHSLPAKTTIWGTGLHNYSEQASVRQIQLYDYNAYEDFALQNAIPTAEGAIHIAMQELPITIHNGCFLVIGYGRIGKVLSGLLHSMGGHVTVARQQAAVSPFRTDETGLYHFPLCDYDAIFNTVPKPVMSPDQVYKTKSDCLLVDLASAPGGIATTTERRLIHALGLPSKKSPKTAAQIMKSVILNEMEELLWKK